MLWQGSAVIAGAFLLDLLFGDPAGRFHPVCLIGALISALEKKLNKKDDSEEKKRIKGALLVALVLIISALVCGGLLYIAFRISRIAGVVLALLLSDSVLAMHGLWKESMAVGTALDKEDGLTAAREALSRIVGRDTKELDMAAIIRAAVETVAENTTDGVVAPLFYLCLGGPLPAMLYKAVNTMDSMIGYKNERYLHFGRAAAKLDDIVNYIPARLAALTWCAAAAISGKDREAAWRIWRRDGRKHDSPNSAQTEAACAGSLGIRLGGDAVYFGKLKKKAWIGDEKRPIETEDIRRTNVLMLVTSSLVLFFGLALRTALGSVLLKIYG